MSVDQSELLQTIRTLRAQLSDQEQHQLDEETRAELADTLRVLASQVESPTPTSDGTPADANWQESLEGAMVKFEGAHPDLTLSLERIIELLGRLGI